ncbi:MAG TPA: multicopper oxidase domain-containing protein [Terriglobia bacterium]|nr:multicopper oxidase domain-containing protein [Terriglobia bacterium]
MKNRGHAALIVIAAALLGGAGILVAHDPADLQFLPKLDRFALADAYRRGGEVERANLEAEMLPIPAADENAVQLVRDLDGDGDPDEIHFHLEVIEVQEEVYPGEYVTFWVFAPMGTSMTSPARLPSPTLRVEEGDVVEITLYNTHYLPHTIHLHGTSQPNNMDGVPHMTQDEVAPGKSFTYRFVAGAPGTYWYHCHVQDHVHPIMGLAGMLIIEPNRPHNHFAHLVPGAGRITSMSKSTREEYQNEYSLVYMDIDDRLNRIPAAYADPREIEKRMHREYDSTQRKPDIFLLNGRSFPFTLRDSPILVKPGEITRLRVLNVGARTVYLHTHGHHPTITDLDGYPVPKDARITRDTFDVGPGQRVDLALRTGNDGFYAAGPGVWLMHDHAQPAASNKGINPGGDHTAIVYDGFMGEDGLPKDPSGHAGHELYFNPDYYKGKIPVFDPGIFGTTIDNYEKGWPLTPPAGGAFNYPVRDEAGPLPRLDLIDTERHRPLANSCPQRSRTMRRIVVKAGRQYARPGEVFAFEPRELRAGRCEEVEIVLENTDEIRHDLMIPGLNPVFALNVVGPKTASASFVTPDEDVTLFLHCHIPAHDKVGMMGKLIVGKGGEPKAASQLTALSKELKPYQGIGTVVATAPRAGRLIVNHGEIPGFMAAMEMSFVVTPPSLLNGLNAGDKIRFAIDGAKSAIISIEVIESLK